MPDPDRESQASNCYSVFAAAEPSVMSRVLGEFAKRGLVPRRFHGVVESDGLVIDLEVAGLDAPTADHVARRLRQIVDVQRVLTSIKLNVDAAGAVR